MAAADEPAPLAGVVLAGGRSQRMGADKASLRIDGQTWLDRTVALAYRHCREVSVAIRPGQRSEPLRARHPCILDRPGLAGPIAGILSGFDRYPGLALLVLACDFPGLDPTALDQLVASRDAGGDVTALCASDGQPHPLCAIWEPGCLADLEAAAEAGDWSPRRFLETRRVTVIEPGAGGLQDANLPGDRI